MSTSHFYRPLLRIGLSDEAVSIGGVVWTWLGPLFPAEAYGDADYFLRLADAILKDWRRRYATALERAETRSGEFPPGTAWAVFDIIDAAYRAGVRLWASQAWRPRVHLRSPACLRKWCQLQHNVLTIIPDALARGMFKPRGEESGLTYVEVLAAAAPLFQDEWPASLGELANGLSTLDFAWFEPWTFDQRVPGNNFRLLVEDAWGRARAIEDGWPNQPAEVVTVGAARNALDALMNWCLRHEEDTADQPRRLIIPDGPPPAGEAGGPAPHLLAMHDQLDRCLFLCNPSERSEDRPGNDGRAATAAEPAGDATAPLAGSRRARPLHNGIPDGAGVELSKPLPLNEWADVFVTGRNQIRAILEGPSVRSKQVSRNKWQVALQDIPANEQDRLRQ